MSVGLVLSCFTGLGVLDHGFRLEGFCVVSAGDVIRSALDDVRDFHPPAGVFDGVIGGDPCQAHSTLANLVRAKGLEPRFPDLTPEYQRVIEEARPRWFLRENVPGAPDVKPAGYDVRSFLLDHSTLDRGDGTGHEQMRRRRFWFGTRDQATPELRAFIDFAFFVLPERALTCDAGSEKLDGAERIAARRQAQLADPRAVPVALGGSGKLKRSVTSDLGKRLLQTGGDGIEAYRERHRTQAVTGRHEGALRTPETKDSPEVDYSARYSLAEMLALQQLPENLFEHSPFTMQGKRKLIGNAVPAGMARALARAVRLAMEKA